MRYVEWTAEGGEKCICREMCIRDRPYIDSMDGIELSMLLTLRKEIPCGHFKIILSAVRRVFFLYLSLEDVYKRQQ